MGKNKAARQLRNAVRSARSADVNMEKTAKEHNFIHRENRDRNVDMRLKAQNVQLLRSLAVFNDAMAWTKAINRYRLLMPGSSAVLDLWIARRTAELLNDRVVVCARRIR